MLHAPSEIEFPFHVSDKDMIFEYGIGDTGINGSDGVRFDVTAKDANGNETVLLDDFIDPQNQKYHKWQKADLNLSKYMNKDITLIFRVGPGENNAFDHFFFGNFESPNSNIVYNKEITIMENKDVYPRAFIVHRAEDISDPDKIFARLKSPDFDIQKQIIIEKSLPQNMLDGNGAPETDNSSSTITSYKDQEVLIDAHMESDGFLFFGRPILSRMESFC